MSESKTPRFSDHVRYQRLVERFTKKSFRFWQRLGVHVTPNHFYQPIPDTRLLKDEFWEKRSELAGIEMNEEEQVELVSLFRSRYGDEYGRFPRGKTEDPYQYHIDNGMFESVDGEILYCMVRHFKPRRMMEVGSGKTTLLSAQAILANRNEDPGYDCEFIAIEPYPDSTLTSGFPGLTRVIGKTVQEVPLTEFEKLESGDILFIDSSHVLKTGSDVQYEYLDILPKLKAGVVIHVHDIFLPAEYPRHWALEDCHFWTEQYLLQAFLCFNRAYRVLWAGHFMHITHPEILESAFASYTAGKVSPGSFWMRRKECG